MIRVRSTDVWFNAPGIQAAYMPISAPDSLAARQNVGNDLRMAGRHTAQPGALPTHDPRTGWVFVAASTQYLTTGVVPQNSWSLLIRYSDGVISGNAFIVGTREASTISTFGAWLTTGGASYLGNSALLNIGVVSAGVAGIANKAAYLNGASAGTIGAGTYPFTVPIVIGANPGPSFPVSAKVQAVAIASTSLSSAHMTQYSRQMAYCERNPDWSAWGRRRHYYYAQTVTAAAGAVGIYGKRGAVALPGGVRIEAVQ